MPAAVSDSSTLIHVATLDRLRPLRLFFEKEGMPWRSP
jgi:hypothetical protein